MVPPPPRLQLPTPDPALRVLVTDDGSRTLVEVASGDSYHSGCGAVAESRQVYLENSGVGGALRGGHGQRVLELGFGTGMTFFLTAAAARQSGAALDYLALEHRLLTPEMIRLLQLGGVAEGADRDSSVCALDDLVDHWLAHRSRWPDVPSPGEYAVDFDARVRLRLRLGDAAAWHPASEAGTFDAVYFDPFSPESSPELWDGAVLSAMFAALRAGGRLVSYCVRVEIRRRLMAIGFDVTRVAGPAGGKREVLIAEKPRG